MRNLILPGRSPVHGMNAMACTSHTLSTQVAIDVLKAGGNAMDAAIAACAVQCVVEPGSTSMGGDCFVMYAPNGAGVPIAFNGSGRAPAAASAAKFKSLGVTELARESAHSVVVPGAVDAWFQLNKDHGVMPMSELLKPAIDAARNGFAVSSRVHYDIARERDLLRSKSPAAEFYLDNGEAPAVGSVMRLPAMADAFEAIAKEGRDVFYHGHLADDMVQTLEDAGGLHTKEDFAYTRGNYVTPIATQYRGHTVYQCPPNGQGVIALLLLNMWNKHNDSQQSVLTADRIHRELEACKLAYRVRQQYLGDPDQTSVNTAGMIDQKFADALSAMIDMQRVRDDEAIPAPPAHKDTVYLSIVDKDRNACSFINTLYWGFGGGLTTSSGITLTNRGMSFSLDPASPNCIAPNKRPLHTIIPAMTAIDDQIQLCFGVMGGEYQAMGHMQFLSRYLEMGYDIQQAMDLPRWMANPFNGDVTLESSVPDEIRAELKARGHRLTNDEKPVGGSQAIAIDWSNGVLTGGSDPRKDGCAMGY